MNNFKCPEGHEFESTRPIRAFCPECGKNAKKVSQSVSEQGSDTEKDETNDDTEKDDDKQDDTDETQDDDQKDDESKSDEKKPEPVVRAKTKLEKGPRKVMVKRAEPTQTGATQIKKQVIKKKFPEVKTRVTTNIDKKEAKENPRRNSMKQRIVDRGFWKFGW